MGKNYCPSCGSKEVEFTEEGIECLECGFRSKEFPEEHMLIEGEEEDSTLEQVKQSRKKMIDEDEEAEEETEKKTSKKTSKKAKKSVKKKVKSKSKKRRKK